MTCPCGNGVLAHFSIARDTMNLWYAQCMACRGLWLDAFDANFLKVADIRSAGTPQSETSRASPTRKHDDLLHCPLCQELLEVAQGDSIPPDVSAWHCPTGHGYFFPFPQFVAFKAAQNTKITYYKRWRVPFPSVRSTLLTAIVLFFLSVSLLVTYGAFMGKGSGELEASPTITYSHAYVVPAANAVLFVARTSTSTKLALTVTVDEGTQRSPMDTLDGKTHTKTLFLPSGNHRYTFSSLQNGKTIEAPSYVVEVP